MAIYSRFGEVVTITRMGTLADVRDLRKPDKVDRENVENGSYVVVRFEDGEEQLYALSYLRADGGFPEIAEAIRSAQK